MTRLLEEPKIKVSLLEIKQKRAVYTIETLEMLKKYYPQHQFFWIVGEKDVSDLPKWKDYEKLKKEQQFLIVPQIVDVSSSLVREWVRKGLSIENLVPEKVAEYIEKHGLYKNF